MGKWHVQQRFFQAQLYMLHPAEPPQHKANVKMVALRCFLFLLGWSWGTLLGAVFQCTFYRSILSISLEISPLQHVHKIMSLVKGEVMVLGGQCLLVSLPGSGWSENCCGMCLLICVFPADIYFRSSPCNTFLPSEWCMEMFLQQAIP